MIIQTKIFNIYNKYYKIKLLVADDEENVRRVIARQA